MDDHLIARGFWGPRQESPEQLADALVAFLVALDEVAGEALGWSSHALPDTPLADPGIALQLIAEAFRRNTDAPQVGITQVYDAHGSRVGRARISMSVGVASPRLRNAFLVEWHGADPTSLADPILRRLASVWHPDWAAVTSRSLMRALSELQPAGSPGPKAGYLTYLSEGRARILPDDMATQLQRLEDGGVLLGSSDGNGFLPTEQLRVLAADLRLDAAPRDRFGETTTAPIPQG